MRTFAVIKVDSGYRIEVDGSLYENYTDRCKPLMIQDLFRLIQTVGRAVVVYSVLQVPDADRA